MYRIQTMNKMSPVGLNRFPAELYEVSDTVQDPQGILVRSAKLLDMEFNPGLLAIARAGVGVNKKRLRHLAHQFAKLNGANNHLRPKKWLFKGENRLFRPKKWFRGLESPFLGQGNHFSRLKNYLLALRSHFSPFEGIS